MSVAINRHTSPPSVDPDQHKLFVEFALRQGIDPDNPWVGGYVDYEWTRLREILHGYDISVDGRSVLEFGCNYGASAIVLNQLGGRVTAVDIDPATVEIAQANARRYGADDIMFRVIEPGVLLPVEARQVDLVICNSVLEYVDPRFLRSTLLELDRVLRPGGVLLIAGTSSRLWPREVHTRRWLVNYVPRFFDHLTGLSLMRGVSPLRLRAALGRRYRNIDVHDGGETWLRIRASFRGTSEPPRAAAMLAAAARTLRVGPGWLAPHISAAMVKIA